MTDRDTANADFVGRKLAELDIRQGQLEKRFREVTGALEAMANDIKGHIDRTRERRFVEMAAPRAMPMIRVTHRHTGMKLDDNQIIAGAVEMSAALWSEIDQYFDAKEQEGQGGNVDDSNRP